MVIASYTESSLDSRPVKQLKAAKPSTAYNCSIGGVIATRAESGESQVAAFSPTLAMANGGSKPAGRSPTWSLADFDQRGWRPANITVLG